MTTQDYLLIVEAASVTVGLITLVAWHIDRRSRRQPPAPPAPKPKRLSLAEQAETETFEQRSKAHFAEMRRVCGIPPEGTPEPPVRGSMGNPYRSVAEANAATAEEERLYRNHLKQNPDWLY